MRTSGARWVVRAALFALVASTALVAGAGAVVPAVRTPAVVAPERGQYGLLVSGTPVMVRDDQLFYVGQAGVRSLCPDGTYPLRSGGTLTVRRGKIITPEDITPPWVIKGLNPQPEPPLPELFGTLIDGREVVTARGKLLFLRTQTRRVVCPDGEYSLRGGGRVQVRAGMIVNPDQLAGLAPH